MGEPSRSMSFLLGAHGSVARHGARDAGAPFVQLRALLDRPAPDTMGIHAVVLSLGDRLRISGLADGEKNITTDELELLLQEQHSLEVDASLDSNNAGPLCAAWIGRTFAERAEDEGAPELPFDRQAMTRVRGKGWFLVDTPAVLFGLLDRWIRQTFVAAIEQNSSGLASLLTSVAPNRDETRAAVFITSDHAQRERAVRWWARLERDAGRAELTHETLVQRIDAVCDRVLITPRPSARSASSLAHTKAALLRCAERLAPAIDPSYIDPRLDAVSRALRLARTSVFTNHDTTRDEQEPVRIALIDQVHRAWQDARISAHLQPDALHAVECAMFGHWGQVELAANRGFAEIAFPEIHWMMLDALWLRFSAANEHAVAFDHQWLARHATDERVPERFFDLPLWPMGEPPSWQKHVTRFRSKLFDRRSRSVET
jgi:hypothetical protein